jgi:hypothetical protein
MGSSSIVLVLTVFTVASAWSKQARWLQGADAIIAFVGCAYLAATSIQSLYWEAIELLLLGSLAVLHHGERNVALLAGVALLIGDAWPAGVATVVCNVALRWFA